ncbi:MAG: MotA/TolQ/ExbB proton channel family protein [Pseudomonadota bacterium]|nr:MotA/TolQ/ExbB proton channel family protein [Pseudomonadota bacterium]
MRYLIITLTTFILMINLLFCPASGAQDMRLISRRAQAERETAKSAEEQSRKRIFQDRKNLAEALKGLEADIETCKKEIVETRAAIKIQQEIEAHLRLLQAHDENDMHDLTGTVRVVARDLETRLRQSPFTAFAPERPDQLRQVLDKNHFPGLDDLKMISDLFFQEIELAGEVRCRPGPYVDRNGTPETNSILTLGPFLSAYQNTQETGLLRYNEESRSFYALATLPGWHDRRSLKRYFKGESDAVIIDLSGGGALRQISHRVTIIEQLKKGGALIWPILALALCALLIACERVIFLNRVHSDTDRALDSINNLALNGEWVECDQLVDAHRGEPVYNVLRAGLRARGEERETQESILQEAILKELPRLERYLPTLNILGAIAPLLGLLGTVAGMIETFHAITLFGTGDPRVMSGGISEAMVTTMLGLAAAIPILLIHTFLRRRVDHIVGDMEEKAIALINIIHRELSFVGIDK